MAIKRFEDIKAWQKARELNKFVYKVTFKRNFSRDFGLQDQLRRASVSAMSNIAEGFDSQSNIEFIKFLIYSRRSCSEIQSHLYAALDQNYINKKEFTEIYELAKLTAQIINGFISYLRSSNLKKKSNKQTK